MHQQHSYLFWVKNQDNTSMRVTINAMNMDEARHQVRAMYGAQNITQDAMWIGTPNNNFLNPGQSSGVNAATTGASFLFGAVFWVFIIALLWTWLGDLAPYIFGTVAFVIFVFVMQRWPKTTLLVLCLITFSIFINIIS